MTSSKIKGASYLVARVAQALEEALRQRNHRPRSAARFDDHTGDVALAQTLLDVGEVRRDNGDRIERLARNPGHRRALERRTLSLEQVVVPAVEVALELQDGRLAGVRPGNADRQQRRFGSGKRELDLVGRRQHADDLFRPGNFAFVPGSKMGAIRQRSPGRPGGSRDGYAPRMREPCPIEKSINSWPSTDHLCAPSAR